MTRKTLTKSIILGLMTIVGVSVIVLTKSIHGTDVGFHIIRNIITGPLWTISAVMFLWIVIYNLLTLTKQSGVVWKRLEFVWLFAGLMGLLITVTENGTESANNELKYLEFDIENLVDDANFFLDSSYACREYYKSDLSPDDFNLRIRDQEKFCKWAQSFKSTMQMVTDSFEGPVDISTLDTLSFRTNFLATDIQSLKEIVNNLNLQLTSHTELAAYASSKSFDRFRRSIGVVFLIVAFAIRLAIASNNLSKEKIKKNDAPA